MEPLHEPSTTRASDGPGAVPGMDGGLGVTGAQRPRHESGGDPRSLARLLRQLTDQITALFTAEMALARSELRQGLAQTRAATISAASGALVLFGGFLVLLLAAVAALAQVLSVWQAALIVGGITAIIGMTMLYAGKRRLNPAALKPERTAEQLRRDRQTVKAEFQHGASR